MADPQARPARSPGTRAGRGTRSATPTHSPITVAAVDVEPALLDQVRVDHGVEERVVLDVVDVPVDVVVVPARRDREPVRVRRVTQRRCGPATTRAKPPNSASASAGWPGRWRASAARACSSVTPASGSSARPVRYQPSRPSGCTSGWNWTPHAHVAEPERLDRRARAGAAARPRRAAARSRPRSSAARRAPAGSAPTTGSPAAAGSGSIGVQAIMRCGSRNTRPPSACASSCAPRQTPSTGMPRSTASREQRRLGGQHRVGVDVADRLLAAEREQPVDLVERREAARRHAAGARRSSTPAARIAVARVAGERVLEVVQAGDDRSDTRARVPGTGPPEVRFPAPSIDRRTVSSAPRRTGSIPRRSPHIRGAAHGWAMVPRTRSDPGLLPLSSPAVARSEAT